MGGQGSGGSRTGTQGRSYGNRTDLNTNRTKQVPISAPKGQPYGAAKRLTDAQRAVPLGAPQPPPAIPGAPPAAGRAMSTPFNAPTARPEEPVTSGLALGAGPGPESLFAPMPDPAELTVRALYALFPNNDLLSLIEELDAGRTY